jgi:alanyl-tRNA synthetase
LDKTAEKIVKELKEANVEKRKLIKELAEKESATGQANTAETTEDTNGISIIKRDFAESIDINRMLQTGTEIIKRNDAAVTLFYGSDGKSCKLMIMAGETAVQQGVNAGNIMKEVAPIFGGGGGGRPNFAQGGGTKPEKLQDAVKAAVEAIKTQTKR